MEKLDKVIAGLTGCIVGNCSNCEYGGDGCHRNELMEDALEVIRELRDNLTGAWDEIHALLKKRDDDLFAITDTSYRLTDCSRKLDITRQERDEAWRKVLWLEAELFNERSNHGNT